MNEKNKHTGSSFEDFLKEEGIYEEVTRAASARVAEWEETYDVG